MMMTMRMILYMNGVKLECAYLFDFTPQVYLPMGLQGVSTWDGSGKELGEAWQGFE